MNINYCKALVKLKSQETHRLNEVGDQWCTPTEVYKGINALYGPFTLDLFSDGFNAKCDHYYTAESNALNSDWAAWLTKLGGAAFGNPPYSRGAMGKIMAHAADMRDKGGRYVFLVKADTSAAWFPWATADHLNFIIGRLGFDLPIWFKPADDKQKCSAAMFAGVIAVFDRVWDGPRLRYMHRNRLIEIGSGGQAA